MSVGGSKARELLQSFIYRAQVVSLYRKFIREIRGLPPASHAEIRTEIKSGFEAQRSVPDLPAIKYLLSDGRKRLKLLDDMLGLQR